MAQRKRRSEASRVVGRQIRAARERLTPRVSQEALAGRLQALDVNLDQAAIARLESKKGARAVTVDDLFAIAVALEVSPLFLLSGDYTNEEVPVAPKMDVPPPVMRRWLSGEAQLPQLNELVFFDNVPDDVRRNRQWSGLVNLEQSFREYSRAIREGSYAVARDARSDMERELNRQKDELVREQRRAARVVHRSAAEAGDEVDLAKRRTRRRKEK